MVLNRLPFDFRRIDAEGVGQILEMFLLLRDDFSQHFAEREFAHGIGLTNALPIIDERLAFVFEIETKHVFRFVGNLHFLRLVHWFAIKVVDLLGDRNGMLQLFARMLFQFLRDVIVFRAFQGLAVNDVSDDGLVFPSKIVVEQLDHAFAVNFCFVFHNNSSHGGRALMLKLNPVSAGTHHKLAKRRERSAEKLLGAIEEAFVQGRIFLAAKGGKFFEFETLLAVQMCRHLNEQTREQITAAAPVDIDNPLIA
jgi:hypothetical protein